MGWLLKRRESPVATAQPPAAAAGDTDTTPSALPYDVALLRLPVLAALPEDDAVALCQAGRTRKFSPGDLLLEEGQPATTCYLILEGSARLVTSQDDTMLESGMLRVGDRLGSLTVDPSPSPVTALAASPVTALAIEPGPFSQLPESVRGRASYALARLMDEQMAQATHTQMTLTARQAQISDAALSLVTLRQTLCEQSEMVKNVISSAPSLPTYAGKLVTLLHDDAASATDVVGLAKVDPSLAGVVLKSVNSPHFSLSNNVSDLQQAVVLLGFDQVYQLVIANGVATAMPNKPAFKELLLQSNAVSFIALETARLLGLEKPANLGTIGLMHGVGYSVSLLLQEQFPKLAGFIEMLDPARIGGLLLAEWGLPQVLCDAVNYQNHPQFLPPSALPSSCREQVAVLHLSRFCYDRLRGQDDALACAPFLEDYMALLGSKEAPDTFVKGRLLPALLSHSATYPEAMRRFFSECETRVSPMA